MIYIDDNSSRLFRQKLGIKNEPNLHEAYLFERAQKYIQKLTWIPGIEMVAVVNSLSMYATHRDSDIDLFIVTRPGMIWFVRFFVTLVLWRAGVWRKGADIRENFCLSFFITTEAMHLEKIALENDIYLFYWIYYMKPIYIVDDMYEKFLRANDWVKIDGTQREKNKTYLSILKISKPTTYLLSAICYLLSIGIRIILRWKTLRKYKELGHPQGVIIHDSMLKFHDQDARARIRDEIFEKNFDK